ncbi:MAG: hypothetical protein JO110_21275, partial [Acetobacteraceae bacterium]|nr:hypothetical protein [Acetobacteraceae bacterium]
MVYANRALAYLQVDAALILAGAGGDLDHFGLGALQVGKPVLEQAFFLEGLLPLGKSPYVLPAVELAGGRATDLCFWLEQDTVWVLLLDVTAEREAA